MFNKVFFSKIVPFVREVENIVELNKQRMTIWCIRLACWIAKATNTHSKCVTRIAFPLQQWLHKRASILCHAYIASILLSVTQKSNLGLGRSLLRFLYNTHLDTDIR